MKRAILVALLSVVFFGVTWGAYRAAAPGEPELSHFVPSGALLYLQAKDFASLLGDWDKSQEKENWLKSKNYDVFSQSRLLLRLQDASNEFSKAGGVPVGADLLHQVAGRAFWPSTTSENCNFCTSRGWLPPTPCSRRRGKHGPNSRRAPREASTSSIAKIQNPIAKSRSRSPAIIFYWRRAKT